MRHGYNYIKKHPFLLFVIIPGFILQMFVMWPSGTNMCLSGGRCGMHFWGVHSFDGMWHMEIAGTAFRTIPFGIPTLSGEILSGYNILMDLILYLISLIGIPTYFTLFKIIPIIWFVFYTLLVVRASILIKNSRLYVCLMLILGYFAGHYGYMLQLYHEGSIFIGNQSFSLQSPTTQLNTQFALSLPLILLLFIYVLEKKTTYRRSLYIGMIMFILFGLKFYGGVVGLVFVFGYLGVSVVNEKSLRKLFFHTLIIGLWTAASIVVFYNPFAAASSGSIFMFAPFSTVHAMIEEKDMVYMSDLVNARYTLYAAGWSPRLVYIELLSTSLYVFFNFGARIYGLIWGCVRFVRRVALYGEYVLIAAIITSLLLTICLIQKGDWWNTVQFAYYGIFLSNFFLAYLLFDLFKSKMFALKLLGVLIIFSSLPLSLAVFSSALTSQSVFIPRAELEAMEYLKKQPDGVVFTSFPLKKDSRYPFLSYENTGYVSAYTGKQLYLGHVGPLNIIGKQDEAKKREALVKANNCKVFNGVSYIYYVKEFNPKILKVCSLILKKNLFEIYKKDSVKIYKLQI